MGFEYLTLPELYGPTIGDLRVNWATPLDVIAAASEESLKREISPFIFVSDIRGINEYFYQLKLEDEKKESGVKLFNDSLFFERGRRKYLNSPYVFSALSSEYLRRVENHRNKPSYHVTDPRISERLSDLTDSTRELLVPTGISFFERFACNREGKLLCIKDGINKFSG
ncbi:Uncharacterised protein [uncultured archaeon]|nr:Uncharacterised protein [uncultured archaeon]